MNAQMPEFAYIRQVVGAFQISMPVTNKAVMLWPEESTLAVLNWRLQAISLSTASILCFSATWTW
jgi:hypothetical protein